MRTTKDKRAGNDRRRHEQGPPEGWRERRKSVERRYPEVREIPFADWLFYLRERLAREVQRT
jgi:hypothetical protein